jgi:PEP-CTERM motif
MKNHILASAFFLACVAAVTPSNADTLLFSTGSPDGKMAVATRPESAGKFEIEAGDDFIFSNTTQINSATFTGLLPTGSNLNNVSDVVVEIYRVFPNDSNVARTSGPPTFSTPQVPTRVNSPSDVAFASRDSAAANQLTFSASVLASSFMAANSVQPGGIHPIPGQTTGGNGQVTGQEVTFSVVFTTPFVLPADHYFFVPQVGLNDGNFLWLSAPRPITGGTGPFVGDLQAWTRDQMLDPDWLRVGADIVGPTPATAPTFNLTFSLTGVSGVPEPSTWAMMLVGFLGLGLALRQSRRKVSFS